MSERGYRVAVVGATGLVGQTLLRILADRKFPVTELRLFATTRSTGSEAVAFGQHLPVWPLTMSGSQGGDTGLDAFADAEIAFFAAGDSASRTFAPRLAAQGTLVIDKSQAFRLAPGIPLLVPEVNAKSGAGKKLIANPNCSTIPLAVALNLVHSQFGLQWLSVTTYQSVSGAGKEAFAEYERQLGGSQEYSLMPRRSAGNVFPEIGPFDESGYCEEERKIALELTKILSLDDVAISATTVRVPVAVGHAAAVAFQTRTPVARAELAATIAASPGVRFMDGSAYASPWEAAGSDDVIVGRLRADTAHPGAFLAWIVCDNLRKGAATNAVQIAEMLAPSHLMISA